MHNRKLLLPSLFTPLPSDTDSIYVKQTMESFWFGNFFLKMPADVNSTSSNESNNRSGSVVLRSSLETTAGSHICSIISRVYVTSVTR